MASPPRYDAMQFLRLSYLISAFSLCAATVVAQPSHLKFERLRVADGLPSNCVQSILQDRQGFIWIGTCGGLARYDGYTFRTFAPDQANPQAPATADVLEIYEDSKGRFWIGTNRAGMYRLDRETETFERFGPRDGVILRMGESTSGEPMAIVRHDGEDRLYRYSEDEGQFLPLSTVTARANGKEWFDANRKEWFDRYGRIWAASGSELRQFDPDEGQFVRRHIMEDDELVRRSFVVADADSNVVWVASKKHVIRMNVTDGSTQSFLLNTPTVPAEMGYRRPMIVDREGRIWLALSEGVHVFDPETGEGHTYRHVPSDPFSLPCDLVTTLYEDRDGNVWTGSVDCGLARTSPQPRFRHYRHRPNVAGSLADPYVSGLFELGDGRLLVALRQGTLQLFDPRAQEFVPYRLGDGDTDLPMGRAVKAVHEASDGSLWIGTWGAGAYRMAPGGEIRRYQHSTAPGSIPSDQMRVFLDDRMGRLWVGTEHGLGRYDAAEDRFVTYHREATVWCMHRDRQNRFWIGTYGSGLLQFDPESGRMVDVRRHEEDPSTLGSDNISAIVEDAEGILWLATYGGGLNRFDPESGNARRYTVDDGLPHNHVMDLLMDDRGMLWMSTGNGIAGFDPQTEVFRSYGAPRGMESLTVGAGLKRSDGTLLFGGNNGLLAFHPDSLARNPTPPEVVLTDFKIFDRSVPPSRRPADGDTLRLEHGENFISFEFTALDFTSPNRNRYAYMLEGFDADWIYSGHRRYAAYTNLDPGRYRLRVRAANSDDVWNEDGLTVLLDVIPPFWMTWWFRGAAALLLAAAAAGATYFVSRQRMRREMEELRLQQRLQAERERISNDLHDSVGAQLSNILADVDLMRIATEKGTGDVEEILDTLGEDARISLAQLRDTVWALHRDAVTIEELGRRIEQFGARMRGRGAPRVRCRTVGASPVETLTPEQTLHLYRIAQEALHNAVKHSGAREVHVTLRHVHGTIELTVEDDGEFRAEEEAPGHGLNSMRYRAESLSGSFRIEGGSEGTRVQVAVPA